MDMISKLLDRASHLQAVDRSRIIGALRFWALEPRALPPWAGRSASPYRSCSNWRLSVLLAPMMMVQHILAVRTDLDRIDTG
jgi:hypothetical protein